MYILEHQITTREIDTTYVTYYQLLGIPISTPILYLVTTCEVICRPGSPQSLARPKSAIFNTPSCVNNKLFGFISYIYIMSDLIWMMMMMYILDAEQSDDDNDPIHVVS